MFARVSTFQGSAEAVDEGIKVAEEQALPGAKELEGFKGMLMLVDRATGKSIAVTLWESEEAMNASVEAANKIRGDFASAAGGEIVSVEQYEVAIDVPSSSSS
jgi:heme-degrading monooxygenase HmoA